MKVYIRKIFNQDINKQINITAEIFESFFDSQMSVVLKGVTSGTSGIGEMRLATDPRIGGDFKYILRSEGEFEIDDLIIIYKKTREYEVEIVRKTDEKYLLFSNLYNEIDRHNILEIDDNEPMYQNIEKKSHEELVLILKDYRKKYGRSVGVHLFGIDYAQQIKNINLKRILLDADVPTSVSAEIKKGVALSNLVGKLKFPKFDENLINDDEFTEMDNIPSENRIKGGFNKIFYGVPGSGKSHLVDLEFNENEYKRFRTTFHPEYTNSDFIGQIIPSVNEDKVTYNFQIGSFVKALEYALLNETERIVLIIEEINRGNASSIFGDIFQLLDRDKNGKSKYSIFNTVIKNYFNNINVELDDVYIPSNLWIVGTMNTSDQNIFTLDTAFKRRWKMEYIENTFSNTIESDILKNKKLPYDKENGITWGVFVNEINKKIIKSNNGINGEDKQIGMYFVTVEELENDKEFSEKILSYLWEDVVKLNVDEWFSGVNSYDELLKKYNKEKLRVFDIFNDVIHEEYLKNPNLIMIETEDQDNEKNNI